MRWSRHQNLGYKLKAEMGLNTKFQKVSQSAITALDLTFTANAPTPSDTQTIANGSSMTDAESGQFAANVEAKLAEMTTMINSLRSAINAGETV